MLQISNETSSEIGQYSSTEANTPFPLPCDHHDCFNRV